MITRYTITIFHAILHALSLSPLPLCEVVKIPFEPNSTLVVLNEMQFDRDYCLTLTTGGTAYLLSAQSEHE